MARRVFCIKLKKELEGLDFPPLPDQLGKRFYEHISREAWDEWTRYHTMLINENRLNLADPSARHYLKQQMSYFFFGEEE